jgi:CxxC motif-containing protein (DUF1111 family)
MRASTLVLFAVLLPGCDALLSPLPPDDEILEGPIDGLSPAQLRTFLHGDEAFSDLFTAERGLGPVFNAPSCERCHPGDGKGHPETNLTRFGRGAWDDAARFDYLPDLGGAQLQDRAIPGYVPEVLPAGVAVSVRSGPVVSGLGLLEAIPEEAILRLADPEDRDGDGISGRPNYVLVPPFLEAPAGCACPGCKMTPEGCKRLGRFGRKATAINLLQQTVGAYHQDMGLTTDQIIDDIYNPLTGGPSGDEVADPEVPSSTVQSVVFYLRTLRPPPRRGADEPQVQRGEALFGQIGCAACHVPVLQSGDSPIGPLHRQQVALYSDLLLHDLGDRLADHYPEGEATGREWRTTPLWGLGVVKNLLGGQEFYLHDGRARTLEEAITLHGGEAAHAAEQYGRLPSADREALLAFLRSL